MSVEVETCWADKQRQLLVMRFQKLLSEQHDELLPDLRSGHTPQRAPTF